MRNYFPLVVLGMVLVGCGDEVPKTPPAPPPTAQPVTAPPATPAVEPIAPVAPAAFANTVCPVSGDPVDAKSAFAFTHEGKTYGFCCEECVEPFKKNPEKFTKAQ